MPTQLRVELVYLARTDNPNDSVAPDTEEQNEQDGVKSSHSSEQEGDEENNTLTYQPSTVDLNSSMPEVDLTLLTLTPR